MIELKNITKAYQMGDQTIRALDDVSLTIKDGEYVAIIGPSGSGKSTLMNVLGCLDNPSSGQYLLNGKDVSKLRDDQLADARNKNIGFVFQRFNLMGRISALRNVEMPARYGGANSRKRKQQAVEALAAVGLGDRVNHKPVELSGGQQQRVAIARALVNQPNILLADEPTGALDSKTGKDILDLFEQLHRERGITLIVVTHDPTVAKRADRVISIRDGRIESDIATGVAHAHTNANGRVQVVHEPIMAAETALAGVVVAEAAPAPMNGAGRAQTRQREGAARAERDAAPSGVTQESAHMEMTNTPTAVQPTPASAPIEQRPASTPTAQSQRMPGRQVLKRGLIAVAVAVVVNVLLGLALGAVLPFANRLPMFSPIPIALFTALFGLIGVGVFALINRFAQKPIPLFRWIAVGALVLSFVPNILMISNPAMLRQMMAGPGGLGPNATQGGFPGAPGAGQGQLPGNANAQGTNQAGAGGQQAGQGQGRGQGNRGVPGLGPLGGVVGGNNPQGARAGGAGFLAIPVVALMLLHVVAFGIIVGVLTRRTGGSAGPQLSASGLT
jgi:putative ABC transport system ATP-binding protein